VVTARYGPVIALAGVSQVGRGSVLGSGSEAGTGLGRLTAGAGDDVGGDVAQLAVALLSQDPRRFRYPGRKRVPDRQALCGILFVLYTAIPWEFPGAAHTRESSTNRPPDGAARARIIGGMCVHPEELLAIGTHWRRLLMTLFSQGTSVRMISGHGYRINRALGAMKQRLKS
jgi:hypothetical protein